MARIIVVTSGKGGVGKTTSSAAIATGLAQKGKKTVVIDFDIGGWDAVAAGTGYLERFVTPRFLG